MKKLWSFAFVCAAAIYAQTAPSAPQKQLDTNKPVCSPGAICFSGEVFAGNEFRKDLNDELVFDLQAEFNFLRKPNSRSHPAGEWTIAVTPRHPNDNCPEFASVATPFYNSHNDLMIDTSYGWTAEDEVSDSPREFDFVTNCKDYDRESRKIEIVHWPNGMTQQEQKKAFAKLGSSLVGTGHLWIIDSRISHANDTPDNKLGNIEWMRFTVEIRLPH